MSDDQKRRAAIEAADRVKPGMVIGLGSGSTSLLFVEEIGRRLREGSLHDIAGVPTSTQVERTARDAGVPLTDLNEHPSLDLTVDGADEVDQQLNLLKGRGGALLREKIVALASSRALYIVDSSKLVFRLGERTPIPVEVVPFGWRVIAGKLEALGGKASLRVVEESQPFMTDGGHYILDCNFGPLEDPNAISQNILAIAGVVDHGLFLEIADEVIVADAQKVTTLVRPKR